MARPPDNMCKTSIFIRQLLGRQLDYGKSSLVILALAHCWSPLPKAVIGIFQTKFYFACVFKRSTQHLHRNALRAAVQQKTIMVEDRQRPVFRPLNNVRSYWYEANTSRESVYVSRGAGRMGSSTVKPCYQSCFTDRPTAKLISQLLQKS